VCSRRHVDVDREPIAADETARRIQHRDDRRGIVERDGRQHLERQRVPAARDDCDGATSIEAKPQGTVPAGAGGAERRSGRHAGPASSDSSRRIQATIVSRPSPALRFVNTKGRSPRIRRESRSITERLAPT